MSIFWFGDERSDIFLLVAVVKVLGRPVHQKYSLEEGISGFGNPWNIAAHEEVDGEFNDGGEFSA